MFLSDGYYEFNGGVIDIENVNKIMKDSDLQEKICEGKANSEDIMLYLSKQLNNIVKHAEKINGNPLYTIDFMGKIYRVFEIEKSISIFNKLNSGEEVDQEDLDLYTGFCKDMYEQYRSQF
ncbi:hypothetical protein ACTWKA_10760 [Bacillus sp. 3A_MP1]